MRKMEESCCCPELLIILLAIGRRNELGVAILASSLEFRYKPGDVEKVTLFLDLSFLMCKMNASAWVVSMLPSQPQFHNLNGSN